MKYVVKVEEEGMDEKDEKDKWWFRLFRTSCHHAIHSMRSLATLQLWEICIAIRVLLPSAAPKQVLTNPVESLPRFPHEVNTLHNDSWPAEIVFWALSMQKK